MGGGLMQLVAYGAQDIYLTGNPQITFFKVVYRRHTNFSMETIAQTLNGGTTADNNTSTCTISRNGDLVHKIYVTVTPDPAVTYTSTQIPDFSQLVKEVELEIGGQKIDLHTAEWNNVWNELSTDESKAAGLKSMQGAIGKPGTGATGVTTVNIPLNFWFCRNPGLALPLIALQYHEVKIKCKWNTLAEYNGSNTNAVSPTINCDYIYLDTDERRRFAQVSHEYLIEQLQVESMTGTSGEKKINFNHPVKELIWMSDLDYGTAQLKLNGHDRFQKQKKEYFQLRQIYDYHTAIPSQNLPIAARISGGALRGAEDLSTLTGVFGGDTDNANGVLTGGDASGNHEINISSAGTILKVNGTGTEGTAGASEFVNGDTISLILTRLPTVTVTAVAGLAQDNAVATANAAVTTVFGLQLNGVVDGGDIVFAGGASAAGTDQFQADGAADLTATSAGTPTFTTVGVGTLFTGIVKTSVQSTGNAAGVTIELIAPLSDGSNNLTTLRAAQGTEGFEADGTTVSEVATSLTSATVGFTSAQFKLRKVDNRVVSEARTSKLKTAINVYSFALKPEEHQPSGTCNFSRIDNAQLKFESPISDTSKNLYAVNYNVLRIMSGMGGLAYSN
jgi:hypothetical protein